MGLAALMALRPGQPGRSPFSLLPLALAVRGLAGLVAGVVLAARGVLDRGAPGRRWALAAVVLLAVAAGARTDRLTISRAIGGTFGLSSDDCSIATEWVADATSLAAWATVAKLLASSEPSAPPHSRTSPQRGWARDEQA